MSSRGEQRRRETSVVRVAVIGDDEAIALVCRRRVVQLIARTAGPVEPRWTIVGAWKSRGRSLEEGDSFSEALTAIRRPPCFPRCALGIPMLRESLRQLAEGQIGLVILIDNEIVRGEGI